MVLKWLKRKRIQRVSFFLLAMGTRKLLRLWKVIVASHRRIAVWTAVALAGTFFLATSFRQGWTRVETDFPNYYTAAVLARHHMPLPRFYDWRWFQRQMNYTGTERQLGGYIPQTPLT